VEDGCPHTTHCTILGPPVQIGAAFNICHTQETLPAISNGFLKPNRALAWLFNGKHNNPRCRKSLGGRGGSASVISS
jgi:hypothetical protein